MHPLRVLMLLLLLRVLALLVLLQLLLAAGGEEGVAGQRRFVAAHLAKISVRGRPPRSRTARREGGRLQGAITRAFY
jgi:hypothetical protein